MIRSSMILLCAVMVVTPCVVQADGVREENPNLIGGEIGGRALIYSVNYERYFNQKVGFGVGAMGFAVNSGGIGLFPIYVSAVPIGDVHGLYVAGGATYAGVAINWNEVESLWIGTGSIGYLYQSRGGFLFRATANVLIRSEGFIVLPGLAFGGNF